MEYFTGWAAKLGDALVGLIPGAHAILLRKSDDTLDMLTSDGAGAALVSAVGGATEAKQDAIATALADSHPRNVAAYHNACTAKVDGDRSALELDREGNLHVSAVCSHSRVIALPTTGAWTGTAVLPEGACDAVEAETDDVYLFGQLREGVRLASITPADWTAGAGWEMIHPVVHQLFPTETRKHACHLELSRDHPRHLVPLHPRPPHRRARAAQARVLAGGPRRCGGHHDQRPHRRGVLPHTG